MKIKTILKTLLRRQDINIAQLSRATKIPRQTIDNWLSGQEPRSLTQLKAVATYFELSIDELCFGTIHKNQSLQEYSEEILSGVYEIVLRKVKQ